MSSNKGGSEDAQLADQYVTGANADSQVLQYFWELASLEQDARETAAKALVGALIDSQRQHEVHSQATNASPGGSLEQQDAGNRQHRMEQCLNCCSPLMAYGLKRLSRGLASSRQGARQGFAAALAATLAHSAAAADKQPSSLKLPFVSAAGTLSVLEACLEVTGSMSGADQRDALLGRVFGLAALIRSGLISAYPATDVNRGSVRAVAVVAEQLVGLMQKKSFLRESAAAALVELLQALDQQQMQQVLVQLPKLSSLLQTPTSSASAELLFISLRLWHNLPQQQLQANQLLPPLPAAASPPPEQFWQQPSAVPRAAVAAAAAGMFTAAHVQRLVPCLLSSSASHPRLHPVWGCLLALLVPGFVPVKVQQQQSDQNQPEQQQQQQQQRAAPDAQQLSNLWQHFVEGACFSSSHERKALALQLLLLLLPVMTPDTVPVLLSKQLLGCLATALRNKDSYLHAAAKRCMDRLNTAAEHSLVTRDNPALAAKLRLALAAALQAANFGQSSSSSKSSKSQLLAGMDAAGVAVYVDQLLQEFVAAAAAAAAGHRRDEGSDTDNEDSVAADDSKSKQLLDQLSAGLRLSATDHNTRWKGLLFLAATAFLSLPKAVDLSGLKSALVEESATAAAAAASSKKGKQGKNGGKGAAAAVDADAGLQLQQHVLQLAASIQPQPAAAIRQQCAARLISLLHSLQHRTGQQQQKGSMDNAPAAESKQQKKAKREKEQEQAAAAKAAAWQQQEALTTQLLQLVTAAQQLSGVELTADEDIVEMVQQLQQFETTVVQHAKQQQQQQGGSASTSATRSRVCIQLIQQLQLQLLAGGLSVEAAGSVVDDLEAAVVRGLGMPAQGLGIDTSAADLMSDDDEDSSGVDDVGDKAPDDDDVDEESPAWQDVLLDLLLALLSSSSDAAATKGGVLVSTAPLREACEAVFRAFAEDITAQGLSDMICVLSQRASELTKSRDEEDDDMEIDQPPSDDDDEDHDGDDDSSADDDLESDDERIAELQDIQISHPQDLSDSEEEDDQSEDDHNQLPTAHAAVGNGSSDVAEATAAAGADDGSDLDDDAMLAMDAQLGAAVRSMLQRSGGSAKERAAALLNHQLRVAALMEEWLKKCSKSPLIPQITLPLLQALRAAAGPGGNPTLADRLTSLIIKHLSKCRPLLPAAAAGSSAGGEDGATAAQQQQWDLQSYAADTRKHLYYASRERDPRVAAAAAQALLLLLAAGVEAGGAAAAAAQAAAAAAFSDFLEKKKTRLQKQWCEQLLTRCPDAVVSGDAAALKALLIACSKPRNESTRSKAVQLLPVLFRTGQLQQQQAALVALQQQQSLLAAALGAAVAGPYKSKDQHAAAVKAVVQLLSQALKVGGKKRLADLLGGETVRELGKVVMVVKAAGVAPRVESQLDRLVEVAGLQQLVAANKPDPARLALLKKARAALEGKKAAAAAEGDRGKAEQQQQQQQQGDAGKRVEVGRDNKPRKKQQKERKKVDDKGQKRKQVQQQQQTDDMDDAAAAAASKQKKQKQSHAAAGGAESTGTRKKEHMDVKKSKKQKKHEQH